MDHPRKRGYHLLCLLLIIPSFRELCLWDSRSPSSSSLFLDTPGNKAWNCGQSKVNQILLSAHLKPFESWGTAQALKGCWNWVLCWQPWWSFMNSCFWNLQMGLNTVRNFNLSFDDSETLSVLSVAYFIFPHLTRFGFCCLQRKKSIQ